VQAIKELVGQKENGETKNPQSTQLNRYQPPTIPPPAFPPPLSNPPFSHSPLPQPQIPKINHSHPNSITARNNIAALKLSPRSFEACLHCCCAELFVKGEVGGGDGGFGEGGEGGVGDLGWAEGRSGSGWREGKESTVGTGARSVS